MKNLGLISIIMISSTSFAATQFRPPAIPLVTHSPYFSIWQMSDRLTDEWSKHWTGAAHAMCGMTRIDGKPYRFMGAPLDGIDAPAMQQTSVRVTPTRSIITFKSDAGVGLTVTFCSPLLPNDLEVLARPVTYVTFEPVSLDGKTREIDLYFDLCAEVAVNTTDQVVAGAGVEEDGMVNLGVGSVEEPVLKRAGDSVRIDWGTAHVVSDAGNAWEIGNAQEVRGSFASGKTLSKKGDLLKPQAVRDGWPVLATQLSWKNVSAKSAKPQRIMLAYDEISPVAYLGGSLNPYWRTKLSYLSLVLARAHKETARVIAACEKFDDELMADLTRAGGEKYAALCALAYREAIAAHGLAVSNDGRPFMFSKENSSNGCIGTVDVIYPAAPIFLLLSPTLMEANLAPVIEYADSPRWKFPFAPHDLGTYPLANGQVYGGGEKSEKDQMPVEESANMLILVAALEKATGKPSDLARKHNKLLNKWADYLVEKGLDPENQLCTDDFTGHLAHNVNLSAKAIIGIAAYGKISGDNSYSEKAKAMARQWLEMAADGDHTKLAFDKPGTWSQKYNLVWDKVLGLDLFPPALFEHEIAFYKGKSNKFGPPLDNRATFAKLDWTSWSACLASNEKDFAALIDPLYDFAHATPDRVPLTDWYFTDSGKYKQFRARPVVGGLFMKMLCDPKMWKKWSQADK